jgi:1,2-diacylglycerol 3-beta-galactosyltransferase
MKRILILMSDTGGGHRAAAEAIRDAMLARYEGQVEIEMIDVFRGYSPAPWKYMPEMYPWLINHSKSSWGLGYKLTNTKQRAKMISRTIYMTMDRKLRKMFREHPTDLVVCVHSVLTRPSLQALLRLEKRPPFMVVVTDLVSTHHFWYDRRADVTLVPTLPAYDRGLEAGISPDQMRVTGLPVHPRFADSLEDKAQARKELGWDPTLPAVLMVGGGDGMGPLYKTARAVDARGLNCQLIIIAGRNKLLKQQLDDSHWNEPMRSYGFVTDMPRLMSAADVLVTKAGPATISEACIAGLPMILYDAIPGQETGNVDYVVENNAGVFAPSPREVADALESWLSEGMSGIQRRAANAKRIGRPDAVWEIADEVWKLAQHEPIPTHRRNPWRDFTEQTRRIRTVRDLTDSAARYVKKY